MTKYVTKTNRTFKSEQHALMTAAIALLKYTQDGYLCATHFMPSEQSYEGRYACFEVTIHHRDVPAIEICDYLEPCSIETRYHEADGELKEFACTTLTYEYKG